MLERQEGRRRTHADDRHGRLALDLALGAHVDEPARPRVPHNDVEPLLDVALHEARDRVPPQGAALVGTERAGQELLARGVQHRDVLAHGVEQGVIAPVQVRVQGRRPLAQGAGDLVDERLVGAARRLVAALEVGQRRRRSSGVPVARERRPRRPKGGALLRRELLPERRRRPDRRAVPRLGRRARRRELDQPALPPRPPVAVRRAVLVRLVLLLQDLHPRCPPRPSRARRAAEHAGAAAGRRRAALLEVGEVREGALGVAGEVLADLDVRGGEDAERDLRLLGEGGREGGGGGRGGGAGVGR